MTDGIHKDKATQQRRQMHLARTLLNRFVIHCFHAKENL